MISLCRLILITFSYFLKRLLLVLFLCLTALANIHCSRGKQVQAVESKVTVFWKEGNEYFLHPFMGGGVDHLVFLPLFTTNENGERIPVLAESVEHSADYRTWTINLRKDVKWHDGVPVTAHDVKFSLELHAHPMVFLDLPYEKIAVLDDFTLNVTYNKKPSRYIFDSGHVIYPQHLLKNLNPKVLSRWDFWTNPVGNGPYRYVRHTPKTMMEFEANPDYILGKPKIERVVFRFGGSSELTELLGGNVDATRISGMDAITLKEDPRFSVYHSISTGAVKAIYWNHLHPFFTDTAVRRALTLGINRQELYEVLNYPETLPIFDVPFSRRQLVRGEIPEPLPFDPKLATQLLEEAGWRDMDGDGIREKDGKDFHFEMLVMGGTYFKASVLVQEQLRRIGIRMDIATLDRSVVGPRWRAGDFESVLFDFNTSLRRTTQYSSIGYDNPQIFKLHEYAQAAVDPEEHSAIYRQIMAIHSQDLPHTFLYPNVTIYVVRKNIRGLSSPFRANPYRYMEHLWIEEE
jgi:peptide/nickel transport system substrate-binding protein